MATEAGALECSACMGKFGDWHCSACGGTGRAPAQPLAPVPPTYPNPGAPYSVRWGYYNDHVEKFAAFVDALKFYAGKRGAQLLGDGVDGDCDQDGFFMCSDGLTEEEREWIEAVDGGERPWTE